MYMYEFVISVHYADTGGCSLLGNNLSNLTSSQAMDNFITNKYPTQEL